MYLKRLAKGTALNLVAVGFNQGSTLIGNIIIARVLMREAFGEYAMVYSTLLTASVLSQLAMGYTASKYISEYRSKNMKRAGQIMGMCANVSVKMAGVATLALLIASPWLAGTVLKAPHLISALVLGSGFLFFSTINAYQTGALSGLEAFGGLAKTGMASGLVSVAAVSCGALCSGLNGALLGLSISALFRNIITGRQLRLESAIQGIKPQSNGSIFSERAIFIGFALPAAIAGYYTMPMIWLANSFLVRQPGGYGEMALYSAANYFRILVLFLPGVMNSVGLSVLNNEKAECGVAAFYRLFKTNVRNIFLAAACVAFILALSGRSLMHFFGKDFESGHLILLVLLACGVLESLSMALYQYVQAQAKIWLAFFTINLPRDTCLVLAAYFLVQSYGGLGLAAAFLGSTILGLFLHLLLVMFLCEKDRRFLDLCV
jgi:O-antigen/teichoic acid export membrane protein